MFSSESKSLDFNHDSFQLYEKWLEQDEQYLNNKIRVILRKCCDVVYSVRCHKGQTCCRWAKQMGNVNIVRESQMFCRCRVNLV